MFGGSWVNVQSQSITCVNCNQCFCNVNGMYILCYKVLYSYNVIHTRSSHVYIIIYLFVAVYCIPVARDMRLDVTMKHLVEGE